MMNVDKDTGMMLSDGSETDRPVKFMRSSLSFLIVEPDDGRTVFPPSATFLIHDMNVFRAAGKCYRRISMGSLKNCTLASELIYLRFCAGITNENGEMPATDWHG